jgi:predicted MFS family arabinose efflux permease
MTLKNNSSDISVKTWLALFILAISTFIIVTTELAPVGLLTPIAKGLETSESAIGITVSFYAWVGALSALFSSLFLGNISKKPLLLTLTVILLLSNVFAATTHSFSGLLIARVFGALAHGVFWAMIGTTAAAIVPEKYIGVATSIVFGGVSAASVFGVPLANYIGILWGWRQAFWAISLLSVISFFGIMILVPKITHQSAIGITALKSVLKSSFLWKIYIATLLSITAHFAAFTYIEPWLHTQSALTIQSIPIVLFAYGFAGLAGNFLTGVLIDKHLKAIVSLSVLLICVVLVIVGFGSGTLTQPMIIGAVILWGVMVSGLFVGLQTWVLRLGGENAFPASALYVSFFNLAIGFGASIGAGIVSKYPISVLYIIAGGAIGLSVLLVTMIPSSATRQQDFVEKSYEARK